MSYRTISGIDIKAIASAIPNEVIGIETFSKLYGTKEAARVTRGTDISSIRTAGKSTTSGLIAAAARHLFDKLSFNKNEIDALLVVTQTPDMWSPGTASAVHHDLQLNTNSYIATIDDGCAGYVNGLIQAASLVASGAYKNVLLCTGDINTRLVDDDDYQVRMLFGDAASATLITQGESSFDFISGNDGSGKDLLGVKLNYAKQNSNVGTIQNLKMDGAAVMSFALKRVPEVINTLLEAKGIDKRDIDLFALHQPNEFILNYLINLLDIESNKVPIDVDGVGNTNSSSIPLLLSRRDWQNNRARKNIVLCGFGVGLAWNALHLNLSQTKIIEPVELEMIN